MNGLRSTFNNFLIDGVDNNAYGTSNQGFSNQVMQPAPDAISEFKVVTNNMSAEYGRAAGATINVAYRSGGNQFHGNAWEFLRDTKMNADGFFKPATGKPTLSRHQYGGTLGGPIVRNKAFFFGDFEGFRQRAEITTISSIPTATQRQGMLAVDVRDPRTGSRVSGGHARPDDGVRAKVLSQLPDTTSAGNTNNYTFFSSSRITPTRPAERSTCGQPARRCSGAFGWRDLNTADQPPIPLPAGGGGNGHLRRTSSSRWAATYVAGDASLLEARFGWSDTTGGQESSGARLDERAGGLRHHRLAERSAHLPADCRRRPSRLHRARPPVDQPAMAIPGGLQPEAELHALLGRQSIKAGYEFQRINTEVQDVNPLYGLDAYASSFTRPATATANNLYNLADFMLGLRSQYALSNVLVANLRQNMHFMYLQDDCAHEQQADAESRPALRVRDTAMGARQHPDQLGSGRAQDDPGEGRIDLRSRARRSRPQQLGAASGLRLHHDPEDGAPRRVGRELRALQPRRRRQHPRDQQPAGHQCRGGAGQRACSDVQDDAGGYPAGFTDPSQFNPLVANITYMPRDYHSARCKAGISQCSARLAPTWSLDVAYVGNRAEDMLLFANYNQAVPNNARAR